MLRLLSLAAQASLILLAGYNAITALWGWSDQTTAPIGSRRRRFRIVIPAHNEESVIGALLKDLSQLAYPTELLTIQVLADRCTDETAAIGRKSGVEVIERTDGLAGKGPALSWLLTQHPLEEDEALAIFDADNRVAPNTLARLADELDDGHQVMQCYLDTTNPDGSLIAEASALSYWAGNRMVQLARANLGWSADLGGTGMVMTTSALDSVGGFGASLTEDQELGAKLGLSGERVRWVHDVRVKDEKPESIGVTVRQRARWMSGKRQTRKKYLVPLARSGSAANLDLALRLVQPGRSFVALISGVLTLAAGLTGAAWLLPWWIWAGATAVQVLEPLPFLAKEGVGWARLLRYPLLVVLAALWLPIRMFSNRVDGWFHTPHEGD